MRRLSPLAVLLGLSLVLLGCPRPPPSVPPADDFAALETRLVGAPHVTVRVLASSSLNRDPLTHDLDARITLGPDDRIAITATGEIDGEPVDLRIDTTAPRALVVGRLLRDGALSLLRSLTADGTLDLSANARRAVVLTGQGWESHDTGDARGVRFREGDTLSTLWIDDDTDRLVSRTTRTADESLVAFERYPEWSFEPVGASL